MTQRISREYQNNLETQELGERVLHIGDENPIRISTGHRILHHEGKCSQPHGHNYEITVEITGTLTTEGWIVDKGSVTSIIDEWDHKFLVERGDPLINAFEASGDEESLVVLNSPPTAEIMAAILEQRLLAELDGNVSNIAVTVRETGELCASH